MTRLQSELKRLYVPDAGAHGDADAPPASLIGPQQTVRAMVLALARPSGWGALSRVWHGVQAELELPAPAIAVNGLDSVQLWFSLAEPIDAARAHGFLDALRMRFLADVDPRRVRLWPSAGPSVQHAPLVPALQPQTGNWSAFVAQDLAPVFEDSPWLDIPPNEEGQASLLQGLAAMPPETFAAAQASLMQAALMPAGHASPAGAIGDAAPRAPGQAPALRGQGDPRQFLLQVMHDETVAMALRIEAAKALLQHAGRPGG